jgi:sulfur carrier protein
MRVIVNGQLLETDAETLGSLMIQRAMEGGWFATAVNGDFVPADERHATVLADGDRIEILTPMQGG